MKTLNKSHVCYVKKLFFIFQKKYHQKQPSYLAKWPGLRDLVLTIDYDDDTATTMENNDFLERLRQLGGSPPYDMYDDVREDAGDDGTMISNTPAKAGKTPANQLIFKEHNSKKNVQCKLNRREFAVFKFDLKFCNCFFFVSRVISSIYRVS